MEFSSESLTNYIEVLEEADKAFVGNLAKDYVAQTQADIFFQLGIRDKELMKQGLTLVTTSTGAYHKSMLDIVGKFQTGALDYNTAFRQWRDATKIAMNGMYRGGGMSVGNPFFKDLKIPPRELRLMSRYLNKEGAYFKQFLRDIKNPKHVRAREIPRDKFGKRLPGYKQKQWGYAQRAGMYPDSLKAMRYNGMVRGAGSNMEIFWVLGVPQTVHCVDCPVLTGRAWTGETLPTVPGAGDTKCGWKCYCHLEFRQKVSRTTFDLAGSSTRGALMAPGRQARIIDPRGTEIGGQLQADIEGYMARMYKARQMIAITEGADKMYWIGQRKMWNQRAIELAQTGNYRVVPTISSAALTKTIKAVSAKGGFLIDDLAALAIGDEIWFVRGDYSSFGVMALRGGQLVVKTSTGMVLKPSLETDIVLVTGTAHTIGSADISLSKAGSVGAASPFALNRVKTAIKSLPNKHIGMVDDFYLESGREIAAVRGEGVVGYAVRGDKSVHVSMSNPMVDYNLIHEVGHQVFWNMPPSVRSQFEAWRSLAAKGKMKYPRAYALKNSDEFFAESYKEYWTGNSWGLDKKVVDWFEKTKGGVSIQ